MEMNKLLLTLAAPAFMLGAPVLAAVPLVDSPITVTSADIGKSFTYDFNGIIGEVEQSGLIASVQFKLTGISGNTWSFDARFDNNLSSEPIGGRISGFGFNGDPEIIGAAAVSGPFTGVLLDAGFPQIGGKTKIDFCIESQGDDPGGKGNCGGGGDGVFDDTTALQKFTLSFADPITSVVFNNFIIRWQSIEGSRLGSSGVGMGEGGGFDGGGDPTVPEPSTWAMLIAGFGLVGAAARRRKAAGLTVAA
ncbi:cistern family PEP-CTERM protein [Sandarakinorhabdus rubra]|uniref:cistern family PEP-CTERM protein n=1 Tax=Sandarakinorhabdus rubra TaxID=2672568 RepID=UPI0013DB3197|nr:cistern family PEP-CTERM protein [Sandarakinorhabdus rubra]